MGGCAWFRVSFFASNPKQLCFCFQHPFIGFMARNKNNVIIWRPFPSPTPTQSAKPRLPNLPADVDLSSERAREHDSAVDRWIELADLVNDGPRAKRKRKIAS